MSLEKDEVGIPAILVNDNKQAMSWDCHEVLWAPWETIKNYWLRTKGKTIMAYFAYHILEQSHRLAMLSTMNTTLMVKLLKSTLTTLESLDLFCHDGSDSSQWSTHLIVVSVKSLSGETVYGLTLTLRFFSQHQSWPYCLIEHPTFEDYALPQTSLMKNSQAVVINSDMDHFQVLVDQVANQDHDFWVEASLRIKLKILRPSASQPLVN